MKRRIYLSLLAMGFACMAVTILIYSWVVWHSAQEQAMTELNNAVTIMTTSIKQVDDPLRYLQQTGQNEKGNMRITWIGSTGHILYESDYDQEAMENHLERPEVQEAIKEGKGSSVRMSSTLEKTLYYKAVRLDNGTILRLSLERRSLYMHFLSLLPLLLLLLALTSLACIKASRMLTTSLLAPLRRTALIMENIGSPEDIRGKVPPVYSELRPLVQKILDQSEVINHTIQTLEQQRNVIRLMMENLQEGVILTDPSYKILVINQCAKSVLDLRQNLTVSGLDLPSLFTAIDWELIRQAGTSEAASEQRFALEDSLYQLTVQPVYKDHTFYGVLFILDDITERERREQLRREFTSNVSHELKTPLTSIRGFAEVLAAGMFKSHEDAQHFGTRIYEQANRLLGMIEEILHLTRIEEKKQSKPMEAVHLKPIVQDVASFMEPVLLEKQITVHCTLADVTVWGDEGRLREVVVNLVDNAVKYNRPGGHVYVSLREEEQRVLLQVTDTGIGIPEDKQKRVFERFYRADVSHSDKIEGSGLGLSIVKHIVDQHQGRISLTSKENSGTRITVSFPAYREQNG
ncbi:sensor histidine kinase [Megasphaera hominis]|uniref:histidine kinase n=1 Tax=Megasphaera hominis TaxID=159836 RepID=A0ABR6VKS3_9FIRM|nr:ATP-binding protein [Megasphaera hominis]MBC3537294.1 histidine kinase [Megasphaera hominis]